MYYGRQIATGSVRLICNAYTSSSLRRVVVDDGRGGLYISGSVASGSSPSQGVYWNKVGNVFYSDGIIVLTNPALLDFADASTVSALWLESNSLEVNFSGDSRVPTKTFMCRMDPVEFNCSNNPSYSFRDDNGTVDPTDDRYIPVRSDGTTYVTAVGIYDSERNLVAVAKLASPLRKREKDKQMVRITLDM
jgi:hypothetical protein